MPLISEAVKWRGSVSLISEAERRGNCVSDFIGSEGEGKGGRASLISETVKGGENVLCIILHGPSPVNHAPLQAPCPIDHALCTIHHAPFCHALRPITLQTIPIAPWPMAFQPCNWDKAPTLLCGAWGHSNSAQSMVQRHMTWCMLHGHEAWVMAYKIMVNRSNL